MRVDNLSAIQYMSCMAQMNISVPEGLKKWAEQRVAEGRYASTSDYMRDLMRRYGAPGARLLLNGVDPGVRVFLKDRLVS